MSSPDKSSSWGIVPPEVLPRIAAGDRGALSELYDLLSRPLFSLAVRMLGDLQDAEDVTQEVFLQIWNKAGTYDPAAGTPGQWALRILRNRCIDRLRARTREARAIVVPTAGDEREPEAPAPEVAAGLTQDETGRVHTALDRLPADQRKALELVFFEGLSHQETAMALGQPLGTVKARVRRGMLKLREHLETLL
jgi:RNA polymerase sigma-70 factor, ECF subfamily